MASPSGILVEFLRRFFPTKDHIRRFLRRWTSLLAFLARKMGEWRFLWLGNPGMIRSPKIPEPEPSFSSDRAGSSSVSGGSACRDGIAGYVVAACTVPGSANHPLSREPAQPQPDTAPRGSTPTLATLPIDPSRALGPSMANQTAGSSHANQSSGNLSVQSRASDRPSTISFSRTSLCAPVHNDRPSQDHEATYRQFGRGPGAPRSRSRGRSSRSPSPKPSLNIAHPDNFDIASTDARVYAHEVINHTTSFQDLTDLPSSPSHTQERPGRSAIRRQKQRTTSIDWDVQNPSTESLPIALNNPQEITQDPMPMDTSTHLSLQTLPSDRAETASQSSHMTYSATSIFTLPLPEDHVLELIVSDQIPRYVNNATM